MAKYFRGDTLPVVVSYDDYKFKPGDVVTIGIFDTNMKKLIESSLSVVEECDEVQLELTREEMHDVLGKCIVEARTVTSSNLEITIQKEIEFKEDCLR